MLALDGITKRFDGLTALDGVNARFQPGTIHGVLGENGAGKTTLMRVAAGLCRPDAGSIRLGHRPLPAGAPLESARAGIAMVHQHFMLVPTLTVVENCLLGRRDQPQWISRSRTAERIRETAQQTGLEVDPFARVETLSVGQQQRVEIIRALADARSVLILDEPTAVLTPREAEQLFEALERLRRGGLAIAFISHKLAEVERICDELTILRRGRVVYQGSARLNRAQIAELMVGPGMAPAAAVRPPDRAATQSAASRLLASRPRLELNSVSARDRRTGRRLRDVNLVLRPGEIVGIAGVEGNGQDLLAGVIVGVNRCAAGVIRLNGRDITDATVDRRWAAGLAHIAEDRLGQALVPAMRLFENLALKAWRSRRFTRWGLISWPAVRQHAATLMRDFDIRGGSPVSLARNLSGGNQQKLILARELEGAPSVIIAHNPTRGLDVAATRFVFDQLLAQRGRGAAVLLIHSDLDELLEVSDRVAVLYNGTLTASPWPKCDRAEIGRMMLGGEP